MKGYHLHDVRAAHTHTQQTTTVSKKDNFTALLYNTVDLIISVPTPTLHYILYCIAVSPNFPNALIILGVYYIYKFTWKRLLFPRHIHLILPNTLGFLLLEGSFCCFFRFFSLTFFSLNSYFFALFMYKWNAFPSFGAKKSEKKEENRRKWWNMVLLE